MFDNGFMKTLSERIADFGNNKMASALSVSPQAVSMWAKRGAIPPRRARAVAELLGTTPQFLCPEIFGPVGQAPTKDSP